MFSQKIIFVSAEIFRVLFAELGKINTFLGKKYEKNLPFDSHFSLFPSKSFPPTGPQEGGG